MSKPALEAAMALLVHASCSQPMYFRCLNNSEYGMGDWVFVRHSHGNGPLNPGSCRRWRPDALCLGKSRAHFGKRATCVTSCEERKEKRCLDLVTEALLRNCSGTRQSANQRRYWYYDRITRSCLKWSSKTCAYNAFRSSGHCRYTCLRSKTKSEEPQD
ncbi:hypothetical protein HPB47_012735 [Ixodes persulcatus]|uniref:Uncharacterized protein n=1 Tax=Ixodes persulcatus TaxID=34615 RepID=A0AC60NSP8_IXOPE|nr:hypothetical protein HPB47_012735 [Ixodes persulcatus]